MNARLQNARRLLEQAVAELKAATRELNPARDSHTDLELRAALNHIASAHVCVACHLNRAAIAARTKGAPEAPALLGGVLGLHGH